MIYRHASWTEPNPSATYSSWNQAQRLARISQLPTSARAPPARGHRVHTPTFSSGHSLSRLPASNWTSRSKAQLPDNTLYLPTALCSGLPDADISRTTKFNLRQSFHPHRLTLSKPVEVGLTGCTDSRCAIYWPIARCMRRASVSPARNSRWTTPRHGPGLVSNGGTISQSVYVASRASSLDTGVCYACQHDIPTMYR
jgi:hypothetical protein